MILHVETPIRKDFYTKEIYLNELFSNMIPCYDLTEKITIIS